MVRDYVRELYAPAAHTARTLNSDYAGAQRPVGLEAATSAPPGPASASSTSTPRACGDQAEVGATLAVRAFVALGSLSPDDVEVQVVHGRIGSDDVLTATSATPMLVGESYDGNRHRFDAAVPLAVSGPFGYTVRVVPRNDVAGLRRRARPGGRAGLTSGGRARSAAPSDPRSTGDR